jgi:WD40 repeat protein
MALELSVFRGFTPIHPPCFFVSPVDKCYIYSYATFVVVESPSREQQFIRGPQENITCMDVSPKGRMIAAGECGVRSDVFVWRYSDKSLLFRFCEHDGGILCLAFSQDERMLATLGEEGRLVVWDMATGNIVTHRAWQPRAPRTPMGPSYTVEWGGPVPDIKNRPTQTFYLATANPAGIDLHVVDPAGGTIQSETLPSGKYQRTVTSFAFTPEHLIAATTSADMLIFELHSKTLVRVVATGSGGLSDMFTDHSDGSVVGGCGDGTIWSITASAARELRTVGHPIAGIAPQHCITRDGYLFSTKGVVWQSHSVPVTGVDGCGSVAVSAAADRTIKIWEHRTMKCTLTFDSAFESKPTCVSLGPALLVAGFENGALGGFDFTTGERLFDVLHCHHTAVSACRIAPTRRFIATGGCDTAVRIWDVRTRTMLTHLKNHNQRVTSLAFVPSARFLYSASADKSVCLFDIETEKMLNRFTQFQSHVTGIDVAGDLLITATQDGHIQKWSIAQGTLPLLSLKTNETTGMSASPDGNRFAVAHVDGSVSLWDVDSFSKIDGLRIHSHSVSDIRFIANDRIMTSGSDGGLAIIKMQ